MNDKMNRREFFRLLSPMTAGDLKEVQLGYWVAKNSHHDQVRDGGERYFEHTREVAITLIKRGFKDARTVNKGLMHDVIEDTNTPPEVIINLFGESMWEDLVLLSKTVPLFDPVTGQIHGHYKKNDDEYYEGLYSADISVRLVKCSDRLYNLRDMGEGWPIERQVNYAKHTQEKVLPLAQMTDQWFYDALKTEVDRVMAQMH
jgi:(p)ppGpp synthase/HD superfamily hydrolase